MESIKKHLTSDEKIKAEHSFEEHRTEIIFSGAFLIVFGVFNNFLLVFGLIIMIIGFLLKNKIYYYATNKRVIEYRKNIFSEELRDLSYNHISSIHYKTKMNGNIFAIGLIIFILGIFYSIFNYFYKDQNFFNGIAICFFGFGLIVFAFFDRKSFYELRGTGGEAWEVHNVEKESGAKFVKTIREKNK
jgi:hypothetical protein